MPIRHVLSPVMTFGGESHAPIVPGAAEGWRAAPSSGSAST
ncbi:MAG TPA: hypothetical protein VN751_06970 [Solirubrobacteraceae bacterium]|nr:hypothetical protein [Solirubrobacteraceae bacterium]